MDEREKRAGKRQNGKGAEVGVLKNFRQSCRGDQRVFFRDVERISDKLQNLHRMERVIKVRGEGGRVGGKDQLVMWGKKKFAASTRAVTRSKILIAT